MAGHMGASTQVAYYGAIDRSQKQNGVGHWFLCLHIDGVVLTVVDAKINTGKLFF